MRVYIAGKMTGQPFYGYKRFMLAKRWWESYGHEVSTPFEANSRVWWRHHGRAFDPYQDRCDWGDPLMKEMFTEDVAELLVSDAIAVLGGWEESRGTRLEVRIAEQFGIPVILAECPARSAGGYVRATTDLRIPEGEFCTYLDTLERLPDGTTAEVRDGPVGDGSATDPTEDRAPDRDAETSGLVRKGGDARFAVEPLASDPEEGAPPPLPASIPDQSPCKHCTSPRYKHSLATAAGTYGIFHSWESRG